MIRFLLQHALVLDSRQPSLEGDFQFNIPLDYEDSDSLMELVERSRVTTNIIRGAQGTTGEGWDTMFNL